MIPAAILTACALLLAARVLAFEHRSFDYRDELIREQTDWRGVAQAIAHGPTSNSFEVRNNG